MRVENYFAFDLELVNFLLRTREPTGGDGLELDALGLAC